jgi:hypothetical protein
MLDESRVVPLRREEVFEDLVRRDQAPALRTQAALEPDWGVEAADA